MGNVYRKTVIRPLRANSKIITRGGQQIAEWRFRGAIQRAPVTYNEAGEPRIKVQAGTFTARYTDAAGVQRESATGCKDEKAARAMLAVLERRTELVKSGVITTDEDSIGDQQKLPFDVHLEAFKQHLALVSESKVYRDNCARYLKRLAKECGFGTLADLRTGSFEAWLATQLEAKMSARSRNAHREVLVTFSNWCIGSKPKRMLSNPFDGVPKANEDADPRRKRRAMTEPELVKLLEVAKRRPLDDMRTARRGANKGKQTRELKPEIAAKLERLGRERALIYKTLVLTGLRKEELASITVAQLQLTGAMPCIDVEAADEKTGNNVSVPLRADLAAELAAWVAGRDPAAKVFTVPDRLSRIMDRDLVAAGIPKRDSRGRTIDVHALRTTFCTMLNKGGVAPRVAQAAMRHSDLKLTMKTYTDPALLDTHGALEVLPQLPLSEPATQPATQPEEREATATGGAGGQSPVVSLVAQIPYNQVQPASIPDKMGELVKAAVEAAELPTINANGSLQTICNEPYESGRHDLNMRPLGPEPSALARLSYAPEVPPKTQQFCRPRPRGQLEINIGDRRSRPHSILPTSYPASRHF